MATFISITNHRNYTLANFVIILDVCKFLIKNEENRFYKTEVGLFFLKMPPLDGCEGGEMVVILQQKPDLDGLRGSARNSSAERVHNLSAVLTNS